MTRGGKLRHVPLALVLTAAPAAAQVPDYTLDTLRVQVGSRTSPDLPAATRAVQVVTAEEIARSPARTLADVLAAALGVDVLSRSAAQTDVSVRGGTFEQVLVLVDGVRMSDSQTGHFDLNLAVPLGEVERVEILRGGASAFYGSDAMTGVINVVTRRGGEGWEAAAEAGSFGTWAGRGSVAVPLGSASLRAAGELQRSDGHRQGTDYDVRQARVSGQVPVPGGGLRAEAAHAIRDFGAANFYAAFPSWEETRTTTAALSWAPATEGRTTVEPRLHLRRHQDDFVLRRGDPDFYRNVHESLQRGGEVVVRHAPGERVRLAVGAEAQEDRLESTSLGDRSETRAGVFAEVAAGTPGRASLTAGTRWDHHSAFGGFWAPSVAAAVWPLPGVRLRLSATRGFRAPSFTDRFYEDPANLGDPDLEPERSHEVEAGLDVTLGPSARLGVGAFRRSARDLIDWARPVDAPATERWRTMNVQRAVFRGLEAEAVLLDPRGGSWTWSASLLSWDGEAARGWVSKYALRPLGEAVAMGVDQPLGPWAHVRGRATRARRGGEDPYLLLDARLSVRHRLGEVFADGRNLAGAVYRDVAVVPGPAPEPAAPGELELIPAPGRSLHVGIVLRAR